VVFVTTTPLDDVVDVVELDDVVDVVGVIVVVVVVGVGLLACDQPSRDVPRNACITC
jgi:hypothetical protein